MGGWHSDARGISLAELAAVVDGLILQLVPLGLERLDRDIAAHEDPAVIHRGARGSRVLPLSNDALGALVDGVDDTICNVCR
jgi:hypothetical protein